jgi:ubiquinone biosynthesis protein COQ9
VNLADATLEQIHTALAPAVAEAAVFDGWSDTAVETAAAQHGVKPEVARLAFPGGAMDMIAAWIETVDAAMAASLPAERIANLKIRERIRTLVEFRLEQLAPCREALRRAHAIMAMPHNAPQSLKIGWNSADLMWRLAGDTATDYNHYTKRTLLGSIYAATLAVFASDESEDFAETRAFLERRIEDVMRFEKTKARLLKGSDQYFSPARFFGRLRYPAR